ncbi:MAG: LysE family transporter [Flavobacteriales bacterium]|nr:LysE family transporter [Flavobacteriales bacterium]MCX7768111.1 LysE family transporter [Flavobacteriales bacterium]MDW8409597.1 LysE family transporter [Flavobacteriales bacterium]
MTAAIFNGILLGVLLSVLVGPVFFLLIQVSMKEGFRSAVALDIGIILSDLFCIIMAYGGISSLLQDPEHKRYVMLGGGIALLLMGLWKLSGRRNRELEKEEKLGKTILRKRSNPFYLVIQGFLFNLMNPATVFFWLSTTSAAIGLYGHETKKVFAQFGATLATIFFTDTLKAYFAKLAGRLMSSRRLFILSKLIGAGFAAFGIIVIIRSLE